MRVNIRAKAVVVVQLGVEVCHVGVLAVVVAADVRKRSRVKVALGVVKLIIGAGNVPRRTVFARGVEQQVTLKKLATVRLTEQPREGKQEARELVERAEVAEGGMVGLVKSKRVGKKKFQSTDMLKFSLGR